MSSTIGPGAARDDRAYLAAKKRADALLGFYIHLLAYVSVNIALFVINVLTRNDGGYWWFYWPLAGGGVGLLVHALVAFGGVFSGGWRERKAAQLYERGRRNRT
jgi:hypothetical protein